MALFRETWKRDFSFRARTLKSSPIVLLMAAAGRGVRLGRSESKAWTKLCGKPLLWHAFQNAFQVKEIELIITIVPPGEAASATAAINKWGAPIGIKIIEGGEKRQDSVRKAVEALPENCKIVVVHDAARIFASRTLFSKVIEAARRSGAAVPAVGPTDTVVQLDRCSDLIYLDRSALRLIQTPQAFRADVLKEAHKKAVQDGIEGTDDASLVKMLGRKVEVVEGEVSNFKITYPEDLQRAELIISSKNVNR